MNIELKKYLSKENDLFFCRPNSSDEYVIKECYSPMYFKDYMNYNKNDIVLDVGANIGAYSTRVSKLVKYVFAYEPHQENYKLALHNLKTNKIKNVKLSNTALIGTNNSEVNLYTNKGKNRGSHTIIPTRGRGTIIVKSQKFSNILKETKANKIKMDIEGGEWDILYENNIDWTNVDALIMEWHHKNFNNSRVQKFNWVMKYLKQNFKFVETNLDLNKKTWYANVWCYNEK
jgi:FkbM family methyltransferase|tara:strand:- start:127 stop:819 length:693 start_codon:yes stop_codon:yes gene_type:complete